jgi:hypothetical protein
MDIVKRLRKQKWQVFDEMRGLIPDTTAYEAADEIERLREDKEMWADATAKAQQEIERLREALRIIADAFHSDWFSMKEIACSALKRDE